MYKVLIVDDFIADRENIKHILSTFRDLDIEIAGECENGQEAMDFIGRDCPDIVVTDIEMPFMNGFELARNIKKTFPGVKIIFCSMYNEFEYAREALYLESYGYVLKPVDPSELKECILKIIGSIYRQLRAEEETERLQSLLEESVPALAESFLKSIVYGLNKNSRDIWEKISFFKINLAKGFFILCLVEIDDFEKITQGISIEQKQIVSLRVFEKVKADFGKSLGTTALRTDDSHFLIIFNFPDSDAAKNGIMLVSDICEKTVLEFKKSDISISVAVSSPCDNILDIGRLFDQCCYTMKFKYSVGKSRVIYSSDIPSSTTAPDLDTKAIQREIKFLVNSGSRKEIEEYIDQLFINAPYSANDKYYKSLCNSIMMFAQLTAYEMNVNFEKIFNDDSLFWNKLINSETIADAKNMLVGWILQINQDIMERTTSRDEYLVKKVKDYIEQNYTSNLNLNVIASDLFYSPNYLNHVFKQNTGRTIFDYATECRMDKAKQLLSDHRLKLYEVAETLGYSHTAYFSNVFKKYTGLTPKEYRERLI